MREDPREEATRYAWWKKCFVGGNCFQVQCPLKREQENRGRAAVVLEEKDRRVVPGERGERMTRRLLLAEGAWGRAAVQLGADEQEERSGRGRKVDGSERLMGESGAVMTFSWEALLRELARCGL